MNCPECGYSAELCPWWKQQTEVQERIEQFAAFKVYRVRRGCEVFIGSAVTMPMLETSWYWLAWFWLKDFVTRNPLWRGRKVLQ
jgi:hypothetical protein